MTKLNSGGLVAGRLTHYVYGCDATLWHQSLSQACEKTKQTATPDLSRGATIIFLPHRQETRGVGGIFSTT